jgi:D-glycero-alpha-D-manno-heptose-7-phosphate kinase
VLALIIQAKAPLRVSFGGGGTDVSPYYKEKGGMVLSSTINKYGYVSIIPRDTMDITVYSLDYDIVAKYNAQEELTYDGKLDLVKAVLKNMQINQGGEFYIHSDAPPGSGLGSSSTIVVSMIGAIKHWQRKVMDNYFVAEMAIHIERNDLGIAGGLQDQYAATFGGFNFIEFYKDGTIVNPLKIDQDIPNELEYNLLICYTGGIRLSANIIEDQVSNYQSQNMDVVSAMDEIKEITIAMKRELLRGNLNDFGSLLHEGWENKKKLSSRISNPHIDEMYTEALKYGTLGGKLLGAGGGGYLLIHCPYTQKHIVAERLEKMGGQVINWAFEFNGVQSWCVRNRREKNDRPYQKRNTRKITA